MPGNSDAFNERRPRPTSSSSSLSSSWHLYRPTGAYLFSLAVHLVLAFVFVNQPRNYYFVCVCVCVELITHFAGVVTAGKLPNVSQCGWLIEDPLTAYPLTLSCTLVPPATVRCGFSLTHTPCRPSPLCPFPVIIYSPDNSNNLHENASYLKPT